jgi:hypothetical protein
MFFGGVAPMRESTLQKARDAYLGCLAKRGGEVGGVHSPSQVH